MRKSEREKFIEERVNRKPLSVLGRADIEEDTLSSIVGGITHSIHGKLPKRYKHLKNEHIGPKIVVDNICFRKEYSWGDYTECYAYYVFEYESEEDRVNRVKKEEAAAEKAWVKHQEEKAKKKKEQRAQKQKEERETFERLKKKYEK